MIFGSRFSSSTGFVGIDLGERNVRLLQLCEKAESLRVVGACRLDAPAEHEDLSQPWEGMAEQLHAAFAAGRFAGRRCAISLPRSDVMLQSARLPRMPEHELRQAAEWEASQRFEMDKGAMQVDYVRIGAAPQGGEDREEILLIGAATEVIERRLAPILEAGFRPVAIDLGGLALARLVSRRSRRESDRDTIGAVIEVAHRGSMVTILRGDQVAFSKILSVGGADFTSAVAEHLELDEREAAKLRAVRVGGGVFPAGTDGEDGLEIDPDTDRAIYDAVRPLLGGLANELMLCLRYFGVTFRGRPPARLILAGDNALEPHLRETIESVCKTPTVMDDEPGTLATLEPQIRNAVRGPAGPAAGWAAAAGLSLRGVTVRSRRTNKPNGESRRAAA